LVWGLAATLALSLHSSNEPGELSQWLCHDDSTINIILVIIIILLSCTVSEILPHVQGMRLPVTLGSPSVLEKNCLNYKPGVISIQA